MLPLIYRRLAFAGSIALGLLLALPLVGIGQEPSATFTSVKQEHNVLREGRRGLLITLDCQVIGLRDREVWFAAFLYQGNELVPAHPGPFRTPDGGATSQLIYVSKQDTTDFNGVELHLPYEVINLPPRASYQLRFFVEIQYPNNGNHITLANSGDQFFTFNSGNGPRPAVPPPPPPGELVAPGEPRLLVSRWLLAHGRLDAAREVGILTKDNPKGRPVSAVAALLKRIANQPNPAFITLGVCPRFLILARDEK